MRESAPITFERSAAGACVLSDDVTEDSGVTSDDPADSGDPPDALLQPSTAPGFFGE